MKTRKNKNNTFVVWVLAKVCKALEICTYVIGQTFNIIIISLILYWSPLFISKFHQPHQNTKAPHCGIWHQNISSRSLEFCVGLDELRVVCSAQPTDAPLDWKVGGLISSFAKRCIFGRRGVPGVCVQRSKETKTTRSWSRKYPQCFK